MGMFTNNQQATAQAVYERQVKPFLKERDGLIHVVMINSFSKWINQNFGIEDKYTTQLDEIIVDLQKDGYDLLDIKLGVIQDQGLSKTAEGFYTMILYR